MGCITAGIRVSATCAMLALLADTAGAASLRPEQRKCQAGVARAAETFVKKTAAALAVCGDRVSKGRLPPMTDCRAEARTSGKVGRHVATLEKRIGKKCTEPAVASLVFGGDCRGVTTVTALTLCIRATHDAQVDKLIGVLYGTDDAVPTPGRTCQKTASIEARKFARKRLRRLQRCKDDAARGKLPAGTNCSEHPVTQGRIMAERTKRAGKIAARCDAAALDTVDFGTPCAALASGAELAQCVLSVGDLAGDAWLLAEYGDGDGFCGDAAQAVEATADALLAQMTLDEKVEQMHGVGLGPIAGLWDTADNDRLGIPGFSMVDGPRGVSAGAGNATAFPVSIARGATWDLALEERIGEAIAIEARAKGASVLLAPMTIIVRHPRWGRSQEVYGEDPLHMGRLGVGFIHGAQRHVIASVKPLGLNSIENTRFVVNVSVDERTLREIYLPHYRMAVEEGRVGSLMTAYNKVNGLHCAENPHLLRDILKGDWGFDGFVESDWVFGVKSTVPSALSGLDIEMPIPVFYGPSLVAAVEAGDVPEATIDEAVRRILRTKLCFRLDDNPPVPDPTRIESEEHIDLALEAAREAIVLLKNAAATLPLDRSALQSIAVIGPLADLENLGDSGSSDVEPSYAVTALEGIQDRAGAVAIAHVPAGVCLPDAADRVACTAAPLSAGEAATIAAADAAIVVLGLTEADEGESFVGAGDRQMMRLPPDQEQLIADVAALNDATIVVLEGGSAIVVESWIDDVGGLLMAWYPGQEGGHAIADVLFGDTNPSGKLPLTFPVAEADLPVFDNTSLEVTYDYYHGYRFVDRNGIVPRFPFGFGLSYTTYAYANLTVSDATLAADGVLQVGVDVTNTGARAGDEIVQLYVSYDGSRVDRPERDLKGFARVSLDPGETKTVSFELRAEDLAFYDEGLGWIVEPISYEVHVGPSSRDLPLSAAFEIRKPNIVFVFADDLGYGDLGIYGNTAIETPHLDAMAAEGVRFTQFYAGASVCSPSRYTLLTGRYHARIEFPSGVFNERSEQGMPPGELTIAEVLKAQGYTTGLIGKWHLGHLPQFLPGAQGFDLHYGLPYSNDMNAPFYPGEPDPDPPPPLCYVDPGCRPRVPLMEDGTIIEQPAIQETLTQRYTEKAVEFMRQAVDDAKPFFLYYATHVPHVPLYASNAFLGTSDGGLYGDVVEELDWSVGELLNEITALGIDDNTLVVFSSDNGPWLLWATDAAVPQGGLGAGTAGVLRDQKSSTFEGGMRVPLIARWPGRIPAGRVVSRPAVMADWMPTFTKLAGGAVPDTVELDGKDIMPVLSGTGPRDADQDFRYLMFRSFCCGGADGVPPHEIGAYRDGRFKLKLGVAGGESVYAVYDHDDLLFDLEADPGEEADLAPSLPATVDELRARMLELAGAIEIAVGSP